VLRGVLHHQFVRFFASFFAQFSEQRDIPSDVV
jgi:hypothetical protein